MRRNHKYSSRDCQFARFFGVNLETMDMLELTGALMALGWLRHSGLFKKTRSSNCYLADGRWSLLLSFHILRPTDQNSLR